MGSRVEQSEDSLPQQRCSLRSAVPAVRARSDIRKHIVPRQCCRRQKGTPARRWRRAPRDRVWHRPGAGRDDRRRGRRRTRSQARAAEGRRRDGVRAICGGRAVPPVSRSWSSSSGSRASTCGRERWRPRRVQRSATRRTVFGIVYAGRVTASPHKYTAGEYLTVVPAQPADREFRLVFETEGRTRNAVSVGQSCHRSSTSRGVRKARRLEPPGWMPALWAESKHAVRQTGHPNRRLDWNRVRRDVRGAVGVVRLRQSVRTDVDPAGGRSWW